MKKTTTVLLIAVCAVAMMGLSGCYRDHPLKGDRAKRLVKKEMARTFENEQSTTLAVGYYECNDDDARYKLRQLAANELVTYSCDRVQRTQNVRKSRRVQKVIYGYSYYDTQYYYDTEEVTTYFVNVALTEKGKKLLFEQLDAVPTPEEKELRNDFEPDLSQYPEAAVDYDEFSSGAAPAAEDAVLSDEVDIDEGEEDHNFEDEFQPDEPMVDGEVDGYDAYAAAKSKEKIETVRVKTFDLKVVKVRNIRQNNSGVPTATAEVLLEASNVTPFGRILNKVYDGQRELMDEVSFAYFQDKGWRLVDLDF